MSQIGTVEVQKPDDSPIQQLFLELDADLRKDPTGPNVKNLLEEYTKKFEDWKDYVNFNEIKYCRNLINVNDTLELIVLCWLPNQESPIHNHAGQRCWAAVLDGTIEETHFLFKDTMKTTGEGCLVESHKHSFPAKTVSFISDDIALHVLRPINNQQGITLHLYSKPISQCNIYDCSSGKITQRKMGYYSVNKKIQDAPTCGPSEKKAQSSACFSSGKQVQLK